MCLCVHASGCAHTDAGLVRARLHPTKLGVFACRDLVDVCEHPPCANVQKDKSPKPNGFNILAASDVQSDNPVPDFSDKKASLDKVLHLRNGHTLLQFGFK